MLLKKAKRVGFFLLRINPIKLIKCMNVALAANVLAVWAVGGLTPPPNQITTNIYRKQNDE